LADALNRFSREYVRSTTFLRSMEQLSFWTDRLWTLQDKTREYRLEQFQATYDERMKEFCDTELAILAQEMDDCHAKCRKIERSLCRATTATSRPTARRLFDEGRGDPL
jgi:hypothetical protein